MKTTILNTNKTTTYNCNPMKSIKNLKNYNDKACMEKKNNN